MFSSRPVLLYQSRPKCLQWLPVAQELWQDWEHQGTRTTIVWCQYFLLSKLHDIGVFKMWLTLLLSSFWGPEAGVHAHKGKQRKLSSAMATNLKTVDSIHWTHGKLHFAKTKPLYWNQLSPALALSPSISLSLPLLIPNLMCLPITSSNHNVRTL